jgi:ornithine decarboxylase
MAPAAIDVNQQYLLSNYISGRTEGVNTHHGEYHDGNNATAEEGLVMSALKRRIEKINVDTCKPGEEDAFYVADLGEIYRQHKRWKMYLNRVKPHYGKKAFSSKSPYSANYFAAVKCNPDENVLRLMAELGNGFDCASKAEIDQILELGVDPSQIIYAQPCKTKSYIRHAAQKRVKQMTFDNADELYKIKEIFPDAELYLRILTDDSASLCKLSLKFGASLATTQSLLYLAQDLELNVVGVSFHVGSGAEDPNAFVKAVEDARFVFDQATLAGYDLKVLDVGGGFCDDNFENLACALSSALDVHFPHTRIIGEPGRYYVGTAFTLACNVIARRELEDPETYQKSYMLYLNDGVYGNFSNIIFDHQHPTAEILSCGTNFAEAGHALQTEYSIWGPTCDSIDMIMSRCSLPGILDVGDWLYFSNMGAYTKCSATRFNGFTDSHDVLYVCSEPGAAALLEYKKSA